MTNELKFSNIWENLKLFLNKTKVAEREFHKKVLVGTNHVILLTKEFQQMYVETCIAVFLKNPKIFDYTESEVLKIRLTINEQGRQTFAKAVIVKLNGQYNDNGVFFGEQAKFKWKRSSLQTGLAAVASNNLTRPWLCSITHLPGYDIKNESGMTLGGLFNHNWGFVDAKNEWYATYFSNKEPIKMIKTWEFENIKQAQRHFEKLYLNIIFSGKYIDFRQKIFENNNEITSLII
jgi:hypothetical protein